MARQVAWLAAVAALLLTMQAADAKASKPIDPTIRATNFWVGLAWTGAAIAMASPIAPIIIGTTLGCMATAPMVASAALKRPLKYREGHIVMGACLIPIIGATLVNDAYNNGTFRAPDEQPARKARYRRAQ